jgi:hypothetical protein
MKRPHYLGTKRYPLWISPMICKPNKPISCRSDRLKIREFTRISYIDLQLSIPCSSKEELLQDRVTTGRGAAGKNIDAEAAVMLPGKLM